MAPNGYERRPLLERAPPADGCRLCRAHHARGSMTDDPVKFLLSERDVPAQWVNLLVDLPGAPLPPLHPQTLQPAGPEDLTPIFPIGMIEQEVSSAPEIPIPEEVREAYMLWRPTPLFRALRLQAGAESPGHLYSKYAGV